MSLAFGFALPHWQAISGGFSPQSLFTGGVQGVLFDISDLSTMFTTDAGTTPVAMPGLGSAVSVGAMLDKRATGYSLFFDGTGDNLETPNSAAFQFGTGDFTVEGWIYVTGALSGYRIIAQCAASGSWVSGWTFAIRNDRLDIWLNGNSIALSGAATILANTWQHVAVTRNGTTVTLWIGGSSVATATNSDNLVPTRAVSIGAETSPFSHPFQGYISNLRVVKGTAVYTSAFTPPAAPLSPITGTSLLTCGVTWSGNPTITKSGETRIDGFNPFTASPVGNHAIAFNNTTARPELRARVNLLERSEEFDNGYWTKDSCTITANATTAPNGTVTADKVVSAAATTQTGVGTSVTVATTQVTQSWSVKQSEVRYVQLLWSGGASTEYANFDLQTGAVTQTNAAVTPTISAQNNGFYRVSLTSTWAAATASMFCWAIGSGTAGRAATFAGNGVDGFFVWGADLRPANIGANVPAYQRIADANTYDTSGFPLYLRFDGIDDSMYTPANLNLSGTDKVAVFAGVRKTATTTAAGAIVEFSSVWFSNSGTFVMYAPDGTAQNFGWGSRGTAGTSYVSPLAATQTSYVATGIGNIPDDVTQLRLNGAVAATDTADQGTGNYGTYPLYIGSRNNASIWLNGNIYSLIIAGSAVSAGNISATEQWVAVKTGVVIP